MPSTFKALVIAQDGTTTVQTASNDDLDSFQALVGGGYVEAFRLNDDGVYALFDEEGRFKPEFTVNVKATVLCARLGVTFPDGLVGPVAFVGTDKFDYEQLGDVPDEVVDWAENWEPAATP
ncbi:hypothetical protein [Aeromicrobium sp. 179-A 4D2 NHS]|uniref:DUF3846 domain-containing protein n=1 Tax=Aeromicrobium sp. 179-A 4D2 NHS TaxID=3142375 RepID=UPI0039A2D881